jgi:ATP phosphoribosyltransferase
LLQVCDIANLSMIGDLEIERRPVLGVPNTGRLLDEVMALITPVIGHVEETRSLRFESDDLVVVCARSNDLPHLITVGMVDIIVTGYDYVLEAGVELEELHDTGFQRCVIGVLGMADTIGWRERDRLTVASQYPRITRTFFGQATMPDCCVLTVSGAAELYVRCGITDLIVDAYMTGETAKANGLVLLHTITETSGRLFARHGWRTEDKDIARAYRMLVP